MNKEDKIKEAKVLIAEHEKQIDENNETILKLIDELITLPEKSEEKLESLGGTNIIFTCITLVPPKDLIMEKILNLVDSSDKHWRLVSMLKSYTFRLTYEGPTSTHNRIMHALE